MHNRQVAMLNRMGDLFQSCITAEDAYHVIALAGPQLFPGKAGALYLLDSDLDRARVATRWGTLRLPEDEFARDACMALRRGRKYWVAPGRPGRPCQHVGPAEGAVYVCMPLVALGEVMGVLHIRDAGPRPASDIDDGTLALAQAAADSMALALAYVRVRQTLREQSIRDPLTGLFNRRYMQEFLKSELRRAGRGGYPVGLILLDLDHFKAFNDTFGHAAGDAVLRDLGDCLRSHVRQEDIACRFGGEEFVLILPQATPAVARERAEQVRQVVKALHLRQPGGAALKPLSASLGVASFPADGADGEQLLRAADETMYTAKRWGGDRVCEKAT
jgi:diguanylate cyclase (GGDEF)-like protein